LKVDRDSQEVVKSSNYYGQSPITQMKKIIMLPDECLISPIKAWRRFSSPILRKDLQLPLLEHDGPEKDAEDKRENIVIRSSELEPTLHQLAIPPVTDFLMHARICMLMEAHDRLLESRAKAKKSGLILETWLG